MRTNAQDRQRKRMEASQQNPELNIDDPSNKRRSRSGLGGAQKISVPSPEESAEGVRRMQNDSKKTSQEKESADTLATISGWMEAIANLEEAPELKEKKASLNIGSMQSSISSKKKELKKSDNVIDFIVEHEGFSSTAYDDVKQTSIGYGTKATSKNQTITEAEARKLLERDVDIARKAVLKMKDKAGYDWDENKVDALTSFTYNAGKGNLKKLTKNGTRSNEEIAAMLPEYKKAGGKVLDGLIKRRAAELKLFNEGYT